MQELRTKELSCCPLIQVGDPVMKLAKKTGPISALVRFAGIEWWLIKKVQQGKRKEKWLGEEISTLFRVTSQLLYKILIAKHCYRINSCMRDLWRSQLVKSVLVVGVMQSFCQAVLEAAPLQFISLSLLESPVWGFPLVATLDSRLLIWLTYYSQLTSMCTGHSVIHHLWACPVPVKS